MTDTTISCPHCGGPIRLDETLAGPMVERMRAAFEKRLADGEQALQAREQALAREKIALAAAQAELDEQLRARLAAEREAITRAEAEKARAATADELASLNARMAELTGKLAEAQAAQAEALRRERALEDRERELALTVEKQVAERAETIRQKAQAEAAEAERLKVAEREKVIGDLKRQLEEMKRKAEQGSQQLQGEVLELSLEAALQARFPHDRIEPVGKGVSGADLMQTVLTPAGAACGTILWEVKRTKVWQAAWLPKLREDQRAAGAAVAVILSDTLPSGVTTFDLIDGIWVAHPRLAEPLALILRQSLVEVQATRIAQEGQATKTEMVYAYLTGPRFRQRIEAVIERYSEMKADLDRERTAMRRLWDRRETQIGIVTQTLAGLYGDLQGIAGAAVPDLPSLELPGPAPDDGASG
ncbi:MAG: DUF2130 domain-containing protein [Rhodobacteraceae bacterium]|nr:DUF2130 domain-containing protein [Paracoccaceae bacterium]